MRLSFKKHVLPTATLLAAAVAMPAQAGYVCTGNSGPADNSTPYFNGDLTDTVNCDIDQVEAALSLTPGTINESLIAGSKTDSVGEPITSWTLGPIGLGTLTVTTFTDTTGTWSLTGATEPLFFVEKYDSGYDIYTYMGGDISPFSDSWDGTLGTNRGTIGAECNSNSGGTATGTINCKATTSHLSVYGVVPVPAAVWLFGSGLLGLVGIARRKKA